MYDYYEEFEDRAVIDVAPQLRLVVDSERYQTSIAYSPSVKIESRSGWEHAWSHRLDGDFKFDFDERTTFTASNRFQDVAIFDLDGELLPDGSVDVNTGEDYQRAQRNYADVALQHLLAPTWSISGSVGHNIAKYNQSDQTNSESLSGQLSLNHVYSPELTLGGGISGDYSVFDESSKSQGQHYTNAQLFLSTSYQVNRSVRLKFQGGPTLQFFTPSSFSEVESYQYLWGGSAASPFFIDLSSCAEPTYSSCAATGDPAVVDDATFLPEFATPQQAAANEVFLGVEPNASGSSISVTFFGHVEIVYEEKPWAVQAYVRRTESNSSGEGTASSVTSAGLGFDWSPTPDWNGNLSVVFTHRQSLRTPYLLSGDAALAPGPADLLGNPVAEFASFTAVESKQAFETKQYFAQARVVRRLGEDLSVELVARYIHQDRDREARTNRFSAGIVLIYSLPTWTF